MSKLQTGWDSIKWLFQKVFDPKTPFNRVIAVLLFLAFLISAGIYYIYLTDEEQIKIETAKEIK